MLTLLIYYNLCNIYYNSFHSGSRYSPIMFQGIVGFLSEEDFQTDRVRIGLISFSEPDKVIHEFSFTKSLTKNETIERLNSTHYHGERSPFVYYQDIYYQDDNRRGLVISVGVGCKWDHFTSLSLCIMEPRHNNLCRPYIPHTITPETILVSDNNMTNYLRIRLDGAVCLL